MRQATTDMQKHRNMNGYMSLVTIYFSKSQCHKIQTLNTDRHTIQL